MTTVGVRPARFAATRLPGKPLADVAGRPLIQHVYERARRSRALDALVVATDDDRIFRAVRDFGGDAVMTSPQARTGSDRVAEAAATLRVDIVVNLQGDEPLLDPSAVDAVVGALEACAGAQMATPASLIVDPAEVLSQGVVKVVVDRTGRALWFSRAGIPLVRVSPADAGASAREAVALGLARRHIGIYAYRRQALLDFASWPSSPLENAEGLEQLRALEHGMWVQVVDVDSPVGPAVDTPEDLEMVRALLARDERIQGKEQT